MKKLIFGAAILVSAFFAASCQQEMLDPQAEGTTVTYTVEVPDAIATKAIGDQITDVDKVYYEVYRAAEVGDPTKTPVYEGVEPLTDNQASFDLEFVKDQEFVVLFWAQNSALVNTDVNSETGMYNIDDLRAIQLVNPGAANNSAAQVFAGKDTVDDCVSAAEGNVKLTRPVSQINVYTTTESLSFGDVTIGLDQSSMTVAGLYNTFNVATGDAVVSDENKATFVYTKADVPTVAADNAAYTYVAMNYVGFASQAGTTATVDFTIWTTTEAKVIEHTVSNVPVKPNYRTNIVGNLISSTTDYTVSLNGVWGTPDTNVEVVAVSTAQDLQEAIENIQTGTEGNIKLEGNIDLGALFGASTLSVTKAGNAQLPIVILENKAVTLDLNGFTITTPWEDENAGKHYYAFENYGTLNIVDSKVNGKIVARGIFNYGKMTLESGTIDACDGNGGYCVRNYEGAEFVMNGGSIITSLEDDNQVDKGGYDATTLRVDEGATATINGGTINNICDFTVAIENHGATTVNGGEFNSVHSTVSTYGTMAINGGSFICDGIEGITAHCLVAWEGSQTTINGGTFNGKDNYNGFNVDAATGATVYIKGGEFLPVHSGSLYGDGTIIVTGGTFFDQVPAKYLAAGYSCQQNEEGKWIVPQVALAKIGEVSYPTLAAAIDAVSEDATATITVQAAVYTDESIVIPAGKSITLDLNGMTIIGTMPRGIGVIENNGTLTIQNGTISSTAENGGSAISNNGTLTITDAIVNGAPSNTATGTASYAVNSQGAGSKLVVNNSTINGRGAVGATKGTKVTINGGVYHTPAVAWGHAVYADGEGTEVVIKAGTFSEGYEYNGNNWGMYQIYSGNKAKVVVNGGTFEAWDCANGYDLCTASEGTIEIYGGTFAEDPSNQGGKNYVADGYKAVQNAATGKWDVVAKTYVAQIGEEKYYSLQEAFNVGGDITLLSNVTLAEMAVLESGKTAVLNLNGYAITVPEAEKHIYALNNKGTLTIKDSEGTGRISARGIYNGYNGNSDETVAGAKLTVENGNYYALDSDGGACIFNCAEAIINGGTFDGQVAAVNGRKCGKTTINGGTFKSVSNYVIQQNGGGELTINNATVDRGFGAVGCFGGKATIIDGTYMPTGMTANTCHVVYVAAAADVTINGGTYKMNYPENAVPDSGSAVASYYNGTLLITGGTFYAHFDHVSPVELSKGSSITGGTYYNHAGAVSQHSYIKNFVAKDYELNANGEVVKVQ